MTLYKNVLVKLSGAAISGEQDATFDQSRLTNIAKEILSLVEMGIGVSVVIGGGNIFRGNMADAWGIDQVEADHIGTLGTVINSLMLRGVLKSLTEREVRVMTSMPIPTVAEPYIRLRALSHNKKGHIIIFAGGNGQPFASTDYPAVQRAIEMRCDALLVAKHGTSGIYDKDPNRFEDANQYQSLHYNDVLKNDLKVMDQSALLLARDKQLPIHVFDFEEMGAMKKICLGENIGTVVNDKTSVFK